MVQYNKIIRSETEPSINDLWLNNGTLKYFDNGWKELTPPFEGITEIEDGSITSNKLANNSVTTDKIEDGSITGTKIKANAITSTALNNAAVNSNKIASNAVITEKIADSAVTSNKIVNGAITIDKLANYSVGGSKLAIASITMNKLDRYLQASINKIDNSKPISIMTVSKYNNLTTKDKDVIYYLIEG